MATSKVTTKEQAAEQGRQDGAKRKGQHFDRAETVPVPQDIPAEHQQAYREAFLEGARQGGSGKPGQSEPTGRPGPGDTTGRQGDTGKPVDGRKPGEGDNE